MKKLLTVILVLVVCGSLGFVIKKRVDDNYKQMQENMLKRLAPIDIPDPSIVKIQEVAENETRPVLAFFYVDWCGYCKRFMPIYGEVAKKYNDRFVFALVHCEKPENQDMIREFEVVGFPSLFIIDKKINYKFPLSGSLTTDKELLQKELDKYLEVRKHFS